MNLENRTQTGADVITLKGCAFGEAMRDFLVYLRIPVVLTENGVDVSVTTRDGRKCSVNSKVKDDACRKAAHDIMAKLEQGFRKASCGMKLPQLELSRVKLHLENDGYGWTLSRLPNYKELRFQVPDGETMPTKANFIDMMQAAVKNDYCKMERSKVAA